MGLREYVLAAAIAVPSVLLAQQNKVVPAKQPEPFFTETTDAFLIKGKVVNFAQATRTLDANSAYVGIEVSDGTRRMLVCYGDGESARLISMIKGNDVLVVGINKRDVQMRYPYKAPTAKDGEYQLSHCSGNVISINGLPAPRSSR